MTTSTFPKSRRILQRADFDRVTKKGRRKSSRHFIVLSATAATASQKHARLGVVVSRKVGNAVARNRVKRRIREWFRKSGGELSARDFVVIAKKGAAEIDAARTRSELVQTTAKL